MPQKIAPSALKAQELMALLQTPVTIPPDGAPGLLPAVDSMGPRSLRMRCGFHKRPNMAQTVPPQARPACKSVRRPCGMRRPLRKANAAASACSPSI
jgi:hypothetical protein